MIPTCPCTFYVNVIKKKMKKLISLLTLWYAAKNIGQINSKLLNRAYLDTTTMRFFANVVQWLVAVYGASMLTRRLPLPTTSTTPETIVGVAIGMASENTLSNFVSGLIMMFTRPFLVGDHIRVDGAEGWVIEIGTFFTYINTMKHIRLAIPNKKLLSGTILCNFSKLDVLQVDCEVSTSRTFSCSTEEIRNVIVKTARTIYNNYVESIRSSNSSKDGIRLLRSQSDDFAMSSKDEDTKSWRNNVFGGTSQRGRPLRVIDRPIVRLKEITETSLRWNVRIWCCNRDRKRVQGELNLALIENLRKAKIPSPPCCRNHDQN
jgi:small-conductance mechanosensitive channel